jgi:Domain of unknown function (DUF4861)
MYKTHAVLCMLVATAIAASAHAGGVSILARRASDEARPGEVISVPFSELLRLLPDARMDHLIVRDPHGAALPSQVTNYEHDHRGFSYDDLVFQYDFAADEREATFTVQTTVEVVPPVPPRVFARFVPERYDDFAWENDRIAHRTYGPTLNTPAAGGERLRGSGIDIWAKRVPYLVVDRWYLKGHDQFHRDDGEGLDLYSIGGSRGAGGTGIWDGTRLHTSDNFSKYRVLANGPLRAIFELSYAPWDAGSGRQVSETKRITVDAGRNFDTVESTFVFDGDGELTVGIGITQHPDTPVTVQQDKDGTGLSIWEAAKDGGLGIAVLLSPNAASAGFAAEPLGSVGANGNYLVLTQVKSGQPVRYLVGAGWDRSGQFASREQWDAYVGSFAARLRSPVSVSVSAAP